jgi:hypothetical protein
MHSELFLPLLVLVLWTWGVGGVMGVTRVYGMHKAGINLFTVIGSRQLELEPHLPPKLNWWAHNYMHLMEYPTIFYATVITLALLGGDSDLNLRLTWIYVGLRIVHTLVQTLWNRVIVRFTIFLTSACVHLILLVQAFRLLHF